MMFTLLTRESRQLDLAKLGLLGCILLLALTGCKIPELRKGKPTQCLPNDFNGAKSLENSAMLGPAEFFNDPVLISLIDQALVGNQELRILSEDIQIANNEILHDAG